MVGTFVTGAVVGYVASKVGKSKKSSSSGSLNGTKRTAQGINKRTGRLKKGYRYNENGRVVKAKKR